MVFLFRLTIRIITSVNFSLWRGWKGSSLQLGRKTDKPGGRPEIRSPKYKFKLILAQALHFFFELVWKSIQEMIHKDSKVIKIRLES